MTRRRLVAMATVVGVAVGTCVCGLPAAVRAWAWLRESEPAVAAAPGSFVEGDGLKIHTMEWGSAGGPTVLMVPGTSAWAQTWVEVAQPLADHGFHVVALDLPPFGYSERPADGDYSREAQARRIVDVARQLHGPVTLVGHSFGGGATVEAAMRAPHVFERLVLVDVALGLGAADAPIAPLMRVGLVAEPCVAATFTNRSFIPVGLRALVADHSVVTPERTRRYQQPLDVVGTTSATADWLPELLAPGDAMSLDPEAFRALHLPTLVIWGREDVTTPLAQGEELVALLPSAELVTLPDVAHIPQIEDPAAVVDAIRAFLSAP